MNMGSVILRMLLATAIVLLSHGGASAEETSKYANNEMLAKGQHLLLDVVGASFEELNDEALMRQATLNIVEKTGMSLLGIQSFKLEPQGVTVVATLAESHLSIHTWPEWGEALIDLFTCGSMNLKQAVETVLQEYGGDIFQSTYSILPRGNYTDHPDLKGAAEFDQFQPREVMGSHRFKKLVHEVQSPYQHIAIWDHLSPLEDSHAKSGITRSLYLDHVLQSNVHDEPKYHETLVHPAFIASAHPPKRVLIVGGGEGGTLRESLKWSSVEKVTMVELDEAVIHASRTFLPSYSNCTGFGTVDCFDDDRVDLVTKDFFVWFQEHMGDNICGKRRLMNDDEFDLFDIIVLDLLDVEELPPDEPWAAHLYSAEFFESLACALNPDGVLVTNFGEAPEALMGPIMNGNDKADVKYKSMFGNKLEKIQAMSTSFSGFAVYDLFIPSFKAAWAFAIGIAPDLTKNAGLIDKELGKKRGSYDYDVNQVNLKLRQGLKPAAYPLSFYSGRIQQRFQYPQVAWEDIFCLHNALFCNITKGLFVSIDCGKEGSSASEAAVRTAMECTIGSSDQTVVESTGSSLSDASTPSLVSANTLKDRADGAVAPSSLSLKLPASFFRAWIPALDDAIINWEDGAESTEREGEKLAARACPEAGPKVAVIGAGPSGLFFLHALASRRRKLKEEQDQEDCLFDGLPVVTVYEKASTAGGAWGSVQHGSHKRSSSHASESSRLQRTNGAADGIEFFDYSYEEHFRKSIPEHLPQEAVWGYLMARVTRKDPSLLSHIRFETEVVHVGFDNSRQKFDVEAFDSQSNRTSVSVFDKCVWAAGPEVGEHSNERFHHVLQDVNITPLYFFDMLDNDLRPDHWFAEGFEVGRRGLTMSPLQQQVGDVEGVTQADWMLGTIESPVLPTNPSMFFSLPQGGNHSLLSADITAWKILSLMTGEPLVMPTREGINDVVVAPKPYNKKRKVYLHSKRAHLRGASSKVDWYRELSGCHELRKTNQTIPEHETFQLLQDLYRMVVDKKDWTIAKSPSSGVHVPVEVCHSLKKGRGVFATKRIEQGAAVWSPFQHAVFHREEDYRRFLSSLTWELACDVLMWSYVEEEADDVYVVSVELDPFTFVNHASKGKDNIGAFGESGLLVALRDIEAGEELLLDYHAFDVLDELDWFDDLWDAALN